MKKLLATAAILVTITSANARDARAEENYPEWRHANREQSCQILNAVLPGFVNPAKCQEAIALMKIGPHEQAFKNCLFMASNFSASLSHEHRDTIIVGCEMLASGMGEATARLVLQHSQR